jgi:hypothetical protein
MNTRLIAENKDDLTKVKQLEEVITAYKAYFKEVM